MLPIPGPGRPHHPAQFRKPSSPKFTRADFVHEWAARLPLGERIYVMAVGGGHDIVIDLDGEGFEPRCKTCDWAGTRTQKALDAAESLLEHVESRN